MSRPVEPLAVDRQVEEPVGLYHHELGSEAAASTRGAVDLGSIEEGRSCPAGADGRDHKAAPAQFTRLHLVTSGAVISR